MKDAIQIKKKLHPRNRHNTSYNFEKLIKYVPELNLYIKKNPSGIDTIDFAIPEAVVLLNKAILMSDYKIKFWEMPKTNLCPPIPGRADYIHYIADLLSESNNNEIPTGKRVKILDIGIGANVIYPIIGAAEYGWQFVGAEIDNESIKSAKNIIENNDFLRQNVTIRKQENKRNILKNIIKEREYFDVIICNPPFFKSREEVIFKTSQKLKNLGNVIKGKPIQNFSGQNNELWCEGGEKTFIKNYIFESKHFKNQAIWFTTLVSNKEHLKPLLKLLEKIEAKEIKVINMEQGNKISRILAWKY